MHRKHKKNIFAIFYSKLYYQKQITLQWNFEIVLIWNQWFIIPNTISALNWRLPTLTDALVKGIISCMIWIYYHKEKFENILRESAICWCSYPLQKNFGRKAKRAINLSATCEMDKFWQWIVFFWRILKSEEEKTRHVQ